IFRKSLWIASLSSTTRIRRWDVFLFMFTMPGHAGFSKIMANSPKILGLSGTSRNIALYKQIRCGGRVNFLAIIWTVSKGGGHLFGERRTANTELPIAERRAGA